MERITIDVTRSRGSRSAVIRVNVGPTPGQPGASFSHASVALLADSHLDAETASHIAHSVEQGLIFAQRQDRMGWSQDPLPLD